MTGSKPVSGPGSDRVPGTNPVKEPASEPGLDTRMGPGNDPGSFPAHNTGGCSRRDPSSEPGQETAVDAARGGGNDTAIDNPGSHSGPDSRPESFEHTGKDDTLPEGSSCTCCPGPVPQDMFEILCNGIFAFTMTLIVKNNFPTPSHIATDDLPFLLKYMEEISNDGTIFIFTFAIVSVFYILFFEMLRNLRILDRGFVYFSFAYFLTIVFIPLTTLLWMFSDVPIPYGVLFHTNILLCGIMMIILWRHASQWQRLLIPGTPDVRVRNISLRLVLFPATAIAGLFLDGWDVSFGAIPITILYAIPIVIFVFLSRDS